MFRVHHINTHDISIRNLILLFLTIVMGFASLMVLGQVSIDTSIQNARQTIGQVTITSDGTDSGEVFWDFNHNGNGATYVSGLQAETSFSGRVLGINDNGDLIYVFSNNLIISGAGGGVGGGDGYWTGYGNDIWNINAGNVGIGTSTMSGKLHIAGSGDTDIYIQETSINKAANINFKNTTRTWTVGADSYPDIFYIGIPGLNQFISIIPTGEVGIGTTGPKATLQVIGNFIAGGYSNTVTGIRGSTIAGGYENMILGNGSTIAGGYGNLASGMQNFIGGGNTNKIYGSNLGNSVIVGGENNIITGSSTKSVIVGGRINTIEGTISSIIGGNNNRIWGNQSFIGGGDGNYSSGSTSFMGIGSYNRSIGNSNTIVGGSANIITGSQGFIGGGLYNIIVGDTSMVGGGNGNMISGGTANTIVGGLGNQISGNTSNVVGGSANKIYSISPLYTDNASIVGGRNNVISNAGRGFIGGGKDHTIKNTYQSSIVGGLGNNIVGLGGDDNVSFIGGGSNNNITGTSNGFIGGGSSNNMSGADYGVIGGGMNNTIVSSTHGFIIGGGNNLISGANYSFAGGASARALHPNTFVRSTVLTPPYFSSTRPGQFIINVPFEKGVKGGVGINTNDPQSALDVSGNIEATEIFIQHLHVASGSMLGYEAQLISSSVSTGAGCIGAEAGTIIYKSGSFYGCNGSLRKKLDN